METKSVLFAGVGGQGAILTAKVLVNGLMRAGYDVKMSEVHGMSQRGGSVSSQVRFGEKVYSPFIGRGAADILVAFEKMEAVRYAEFLKPGGIAGLIYVTPYYNMAKALVFEELKGRAIALDAIQSSINEGLGPIKLGDIIKMLNDLGDKIEQDKKQSQPAVQKYAPALLGISGMYAGSSFPLTPDQPVILGRDGATAQIVFSQGAQKISRRHCEVMFISQTQQYRVTDFSSNGTYVNGGRLPANSPVMLARGTQISLGDSNNIMKLL